MLSSPTRTRRRLRAGMWVLGLPQLLVGVYALALPRDFWRDFPVGRGWVSALGPYNEHLVRDVGALFIAISAVVLFAANRPERRTAVGALVAWLLFVVPHFVFHASHTESFGTLDNALQIAVLGFQVVLPLVLLRWARKV
ncbi:MAG: hypothetical protein ACRDKZ_05975 [Actinomycetota bacterium]